MNNRTRISVLTVCLLLGVALWLPGSFSRQVAAQTVGLTGSYGFTVTELYNGRAHDPAATMGVINFDLTGNTVVNFTTVQSDSDPEADKVRVQAAHLTGTYTMQSDGTGTITFQVPDEPNVSVSFVLTDGGEGMMLLQTEGTRTVSVGTARRQ